MKAEARGSGIVAAGARCVSSATLPNPTGLFGLVVRLLAALAVCGWFSVLAVTHPVEWGSPQARGLPAVLWRHASLVAVLHGLFSILR